jgi:outer membrane biosynthesis protein TonB
VELDNKTSSQMYEFRPLISSARFKGGVFGTGRILLGRTESCDLMIGNDSVSAVHAVVEISPNKIVIYDMNSTNGTFVNGDKVIVKELHPGDIVRLAEVEFSFHHYNAKEAAPPVLESLEPEHGSASVKPRALPELPPESAAKSLPRTAPKVSSALPSIVYPLAADPKAEFSEYIFEDKDVIYPIFRYETAKQAVEVIILFKDQVYSVDYLAEGKKTYFITGLMINNEEVEFPYLGKNEKFPFVDSLNGHTTVHTLPGFDVFFLSDKKKDSGHVGASVELQGQDLLRFHKGDLQIFVRNVSAPPKVAPAPILKRDPDFQKYLFLLLFLVGLLSVGLNVIEVPEDEKKDELAPERLATILYKQPLTVSKNKSVEKTEKAPKIAQKAPDKPAVKKEVPTEKQPEVKKPDLVTTKDQSQKPDPGSKTATTKKIVKQGTVRPTPSDQVAKPEPAASNKQAPTTKTAAALSQVSLQSQGHVEVYKSADFKSSISSLVAKGGSLSGIQAKGVSGSTGNLSGVATGVSSGTGTVKTADIGTNQGSLVGATSGVLGNSKGAEGLSSKKAIYTAGIPSETVVLGSMDPDVIRRILLEHLPQFRYCYQKELEKSGSDVYGVIKLNFTIGASGHVSNAGIDGSSNLPAQVKSCVVGVLRGIAFPEPMGGGVVEVKQPMNFQSKTI